MKGGFALGTKVYCNGHKITITTEPYVKYGMSWQDGVTDGGKTYTVLTSEQRKVEVVKTVEITYNCKICDAIVVLEGPPEVFDGDESLCLSCALKALFGG